MHQQIQAAVERFLKSLQPFDRLLIAYSGGLDSTVLLHCLHTLYPDNRERLIALHVNHGLQSVSPSWAKHCLNQAETLGVSFKQFDIELGNASANIEARARDARYDAFFSIMTNQDLLLTAHHRDDQAETLLLNLMRGSGVDGLSAMPPVQSVEQGRLARPLLEFSRQQLQQYAEHFKLQWINDASNDDSRFDRNFIRLKVMPLLSSRWPHANSALARSAGHCRDTRYFVEQQMSALLRLDKDKLHRLHVEQLLSMDNYQRQLALRYWLRQLSVTIPGQLIVENLAAQLDTNDNNAACLAEWSDLRIYRHADFLWLVKPYYKSLSGTEYQLAADEIQINLALPYPAGTLQLVFDEKQRPEEHKLMIRFREAGQTLRLAGRQGARSLKKLLQEWQVPAWLRDCVPLLVIDGQLVSIADYAWCEGSGQIGNPLKSVEWQPDSEFDWRDEPRPLRQKDQ